MMVKVIAAGALVLGLGLAVHAGEPPDPRAEPKTARAAVKLAQEALDAKRYDAAADLMQRAYELDQDPLWLANSGYARMLSGEPERAVDALKAALANAKLTGGARERALDRLLAAQTARTALDEARSAEAEGDLARAAAKHDAAFQAAPVGRWALQAGALWERAGDRERARKSYGEAAARAELSDADRAAGAAAIARLDAPTSPEVPHVPDDRKPPDAKLVHIAVPPPDEPPPGADHTVSWVLLSTGGALVGGAVACWVIGQGAYDDVQAAQDGAGAGGVTALTRAAAQDKLASGDTLVTLGAVLGGVGAAAIVTGTILLFTSDGAPTTEGRTTVTVGPTPGGAALGWRTSF